MLEFRVIGINININTESAPNDNIVNKKSLGLSREFLQSEFKDSLKRINRNLSLQLQDIINIYGRYGWEHYFQGQIGNLVTLYFKRSQNLNSVDININLSPSEEALLQSLDKDQLP